MGASTVGEQLDTTALDQAAYLHQMRLLKSMHCARPVEYQGKHQFINGLSLNGAGGNVEMTVYLKGIPGGIDCSKVQITKTTNEGDGNGQGD